MGAKHSNTSLWGAFRFQAGFVEPRQALQHRATSPTPVFILNTQIDNSTSFSLLAFSSGSLLLSSKEGFVQSCYPRGSYGLRRGSTCNQGQSLSCKKAPTSEESFRHGRDDRGHSPWWEKLSKWQKKNNQSKRSSRRASTLEIWKSRVLLLQTALKTCSDC